MTKIEIMDGKNYLVNKSEKLLLSEHILSTQALKIMSCLICMIKKNDSDFKEYVFTSKDFKELIGTKSHNVINDMVKVSNELLEKKVKIDLGKDILLTHMVISAKYEKTRGSYLIFKIHPELKPFLLNLKKKYLSYNIKNILYLKSNYSIRLYELLKHKYNQQIPHTRNPIITFKVSLDELREMFQIPKSYNVSKIETRILKKSQDEFEKTDIFFTYELNKKYGYRYDEISFFIGKNK